MNIPRYLLKNLFLGNIENAKEQRSNGRCKGRCPVCGDSKKDKGSQRLWLLMDKDPAVLY